MLFDSSIRKELARSFGASLLVLLTVVMTMMLIRMLGQASKGVISPSDVLLVMGLTVLGHLPTILTLSLFVTLVATLSRMYRDSEMAIWFSSGQGLASLLQPFFRFAWPILAVVAVLSLLVWPWSNQEILDVRTRFEQRSDLDRIAPGEFQESSDGSRVFFIDKERLSEEAASNVFVLENRQGKEIITSAQSAHMQHQAGWRYAVLEHGQRIEIDPQTGQSKLTQFASYSLLLNASQRAQAELNTRSLPTWQLWSLGGAENFAELGWRISQPLLGCNLLLLALAITRINPRVGQSSSLMMALLVFVVYFNLLNTGQNWVASGRIGVAGFLGGLHGGVLALALAGLWARHQQWSPQLLWQRNKVKVAL